MLMFSVSLRRLTVIRKLFLKTYRASGGLRLNEVGIKVIIILKVDLKHGAFLDRIAEGILRGTLMYHWVCPSLV